MKKIFRIFLIIYVPTLILCMVAQQNLNNAIAEAVACDGSDAEIEFIMMNHGFDFCNWELNTMPSTSEKIKALFR
jgi:hypothetical protein